MEKNFTGLTIFSVGNGITYSPFFSNAISREMDIPMFKFFRYIVKNEISKSLDGHLT